MSSSLLRLILLMTIASCGTKGTKNEELRPSVDGSVPAATVDTTLNEIILVNAGGQRCEMAEMINLISKSNPKAIGVNFLYKDERDSICDSALQHAIIQSSKIVLCEGFENGKHVQSHRKFQDSAMLSGVSGLSEDNNGVIGSYYRVSDHRGKWEYSFPFHLALQYDLTRDSELAAKSGPQDYPILFFYSYDEFIMIDGIGGVRNDLSIFKDKIVIIGSMGQATDDLLPTPVTTTSSTKTFGTVIVANVVLNILHDLDTGNVLANKYSEFIKEQQKSKKRD